MYDTIKGPHSHAIGHGWRVAAEVGGVAVLTLVIALAVMFYRARFALTHLLESYA